MRSRSLLWSFDYAIQGIVYAVRTQRNMRIHMGAAALAMIAGVLVGVTRFEMIAILLAIGLVLVSELANTAIEAVVDMNVDRFDPHAKTAKDVAAGAVLLSSVIALAIGYAVFFEHVADIITGGLALVEHAPPILSLVALALTCLAVIVSKALTGAHSFLRGGWPSGHTALAASAAATIAFVTESPLAFVGALFMVALVAQSRVESKVHTGWQVFLGGLLGFVLTAAVFQVFFV